MLVRTEAVVLRSIPYGETSRIATLYTKEKGKVTVIAKGARSSKSKYGSTTQPLSVVQAVFYYRPNRSVQTLSQCAHTRILRLDSLDKLSAGLRTLELTNALTEEEAQQEIFNLLVSVLSSIQNTSTNATLLQLYFEMQLATALGFAPSFERKLVATLPKTGGFLLYESGEITHEGLAGPNAQRASKASLRTFAILSRAKLEVIATLTPPPIDEVTQLVSRFMRYHVADAYPVRGNRILSQVRSSQ